MIGSFNEERTVYNIFRMIVSITIWVLLENSLIILIIDLFYQIRSFSFLILYSNEDLLFYYHL